MQEKYGKAGPGILYTVYHFTIVEVTVAMLVLAVLLTIIMQFFSSAQKGWSSTSGKATIFENARVALGMLNRQIQGIYYKNNVVPFYHKGSDYDNENKYSNDMICFVAYLNEPPNDYCTSNACEVQYQLYYNTDDDTVQDTAGWLLMSITGNKVSTSEDNDSWNFYDYAANNLEIYKKDGSYENAVFTGSTGSRNCYYKLIPYVTEFSCKGYNSGGSIISGDESDSSVIPSSLEITLKLLSRNDWNKWISLGANGNKNNNSVITNETSTAENFRNKKEHTFRRTIYIGKRD
ncbi:MAG: type II secretion system GspH family protein [Victivallales bacterium]|nr:type II secretion system GspH family protein [Victivallales bacterium]